MPRPHVTQVEPSPWRRHRRLRVVLLVLVVFLAAAWVVLRDELRSNWQAAVITASLDDPDGHPGALVRALTREPGTVEDRTAGPLKGEFVRAGTRDAAPVVVLVVPAAEVEEEAAQRELHRAQRALARAGIGAWSLRLDDAGSGSGLAAQNEDLARALLAIGEDDATQAHRVSVFAIGTTASQVLVVGARPDVDEHVRAIVAVQPIADVQGLVRLTLTGTTRDAEGRDAEHPAAGSVRREAGSLLVGSLRSLAGDEGSPADDLLAQAQATDDPIGALERMPPALFTGDLAGVLPLLRAQTADQFDDAWTALPPPVLLEASTLSPTSVAEDLDARVLVVEPRDDSRYPAADGERLVEQLRDARLLRTPLLDPDAAPDVGLATASALRTDVTWLLEAATG